MPVTGAYCFTMANNYNAALRPPVIFCGGGTGRLAVRRETYADLMAREIGFAGPAGRAPGQRHGGAGGNSLWLRHVNLSMTCAETRQTCVQRGDNNVDR